MGTRVLYLFKKRERKRKNRKEVIKNENKE
jgi:hypothetical protein